MMGERAIRMSGCRHLIVRTAWLYSAWGKNFVRTMLSLTGSRDRLRVVSDQVGCPTWAADLAGALLALLDCGAEGICHFSGEGQASWWEFASAINDLSGHHCLVEPIPSADYPSKVRRPSYSVLDKSRYKALTGREVPHWRASLARFLDSLSHQA